MYNIPKLFFWIHVWELLRTSEAICWKIEQWSTTGNWRKSMNRCLTCVSHWIDVFSKFWYCSYKIDISNYLPTKDTSDEHFDLFTSFNSSTSFLSVNFWVGGKKVFSFNFLQILFILFEISIDFIVSCCVVFKKYYIIAFTHFTCHKEM